MFLFIRVHPRLIRVHPRSLPIVSTRPGSVPGLALSFLKPAHGFGW
jgi:hypothetical protein